MKFYDRGVDRDYGMPALMVWVTDYRTQAIPCGTDTKPLAAEHGGAMRGIWHLELGGKCSGGSWQYGPRGDPG